MSDIEYLITRDDKAGRWRVVGKLELRFETAMTDEEIRSADDWRRVLEERKDGIRCMLWNAAMNEFRDMEGGNMQACYDNGREMTYEEVSSRLDIIALVNEGEGKVTETDKALAVAGFVRFRGEKGPIMLRAMDIDMILPIDGGLCRIVVGECYADVDMAAADAQARLAEVLKERGA